MAKVPTPRRQKYVTSTSFTFLLFPTFLTSHHLSNLFPPHSLPVAVPNSGPDGMVAVDCPLDDAAAGGWVAVAVALQGDHSVTGTYTEP